jgi:hypothetical protein
LFSESRRASFSGPQWIHSATDEADTLLEGKAHFVSLGPQYVASAVFSERFHAGLAVYFVIHTILISLAFFRTLV